MFVAITMLIVWKTIYFHNTITYTIWYWFANCISNEIISYGSNAFNILCRRCLSSFEITLAGVVSNFWRSFVAVLKWHYNTFKLFRKILNVMTRLVIAPKCHDPTRFSYSIELNEEHFNIMWTYTYNIHTYII